MDDQDIKFKLLVVDDEPGIVDFIQKNYNRKGFTTFGALDGITAVEICKKEKPHVSLIDIHMPLSEINGIETLKRIKEVSSDTYCIMVTRVAEKEKIQASCDIGAFTYIFKPINLEQLDAVVLAAKELALGKIS